MTVIDFDDALAGPVCPLVRARDSIDCNRRLALYVKAEDYPIRIRKRQTFYAFMPAG